MMKRHITTIFILCTVLLTGLSTSCTESLTNHQTVRVDDSDLAATRLTFQVTDMSNPAETTRASIDADDKLEDLTAEEKRGMDVERQINNIWVFQFDATAAHNLLITPRYYDLSEKNLVPDEDNGAEINVMLKPAVESIVYVVANTGDNTWATVENSPTLEDVKKQTLPDPKCFDFKIGQPIDNLSLPMEGASTTVTPTKDNKIDVKLTRMYAKMEIQLGAIPETIIPRSVNVMNIPDYSQIGTLATSDPTKPGNYPENDKIWISRSFSPGTANADGEYPGIMTIYIPENLQGRYTGENADDATLKTSRANQRALCVNFRADYIDIYTKEIKDRLRSYDFYPGGNIYNDYNIRRNCIYRVKLNLYTDIYNQDTPSSNCFVTKPGQHLSFLPYYRTEDGGGYKFSDYLDPEGSDEKKINDSDNMLDNIKIIWQTKGTIGDNSDGSRVWIDRREDVKGDEFHRKIHVQTGEEGNALIAAYNNKGEIIWSWHIWVTEKEPSNFSNAIIYTTYSWDAGGIYTSRRVPGYAIMPCNLGALRFEPESTALTDVNKTFGMLYQWGRKDPFPPAIQNLAIGSQEYEDFRTGKHYANDNSTLVTKTAAAETEKLFHSVPGSEITEVAYRDPILFTIQNPTVFMCGTALANQNESYVEAFNKTNYPNDGDWSWKHDNKLWGGLDPTMEKKDGKYIMPFYTIGNAHMFDNYGDKKSIFDPCPAGWRVPPGDLWLGFTSTGQNPGKYEQINTDATKNSSYGMYMYLQGWKTGPTTFFPTNGPRVPDGKLIRTSSCGNYHNATADLQSANSDICFVNILHIHNAPGLFHIFERDFPMYYQKSVAGPIRCVRDHR